jgi:hypothetical protein
MFNITYFEGDYQNGGVKFIESPNTFLTSSITMLATYTTSLLDDEITFDKVAEIAFEMQGILYEPEVFGAESNKIGIEILSPTFLVDGDPSDVQSIDHLSYSLLP